MSEFKIKLDVEPKWEIIQPGLLLWQNTRLAVVYIRGDIAGLNFHAHRLAWQGNEMITESCFGTMDNLEDAKEVLKTVYKDLLLMGIDP